MYSMMIADDEQIEQRVLRKMAADFCPQLRFLPCASNGAELISRMEKECPDILVLDINMPVLNGLEVLEWIRLKKLSVKILMISAYSKFQYAQQSVNMGADGYLLKPLGERDFVNAVRKLCDQLDREREEDTQLGHLEHLRSQYQKSLENELLSDLLLGDIRPERVELYLRQLPFPFCGGGSCILRSTSGSFGEQETQLALILSGAGKLCTCFWKQYRDFYALCILAEPEEESGSFEWQVREVFRCVKRRYPGKIWESLVIGISSFKTALEEFPAAMKEGKIAAYGVSEPGCYPYRDGSTKEQLCSFRKEFYECRCLLQTEEGEQGSEKLRNIFFSLEKKAEGTVFFRIFSFALLCGSDRGLQEDGLFEGELCRISDWEQLSAMQETGELLSFILKRKGSGDRKGSPWEDASSHVGKCIRYLSVHFRERLFLEETAKHMGISSFYLSRLFKQESGKTFLEILTELRLLAAMDLMWKTDLSFAQITEQTGYDNVSYFYKLFKKKMGMGASGMREVMKRFL